MEPSEIAVRLIECTTARARAPTGHFRPYAPEKSLLVSCHPRARATRSSQRLRSPATQTPCPESAPWDRDLGPSSATGRSMSGRSQVCGGPVSECFRVDQGSRRTESAFSMSGSRTEHRSACVRRTATSGCAGRSRKSVLSELRSPWTGTTSFQPSGKANSCPLSSTPAVSRPTSLAWVMRFIIQANPSPALPVSWFIRTATG